MNDKTGNELIAELLMITVNAFEMIKEETKDDQTLFRQPNHEMLQELFVLVLDTVLGRPKEDKD